MTLETDLRAVVADLDHLTLAPTRDGRWQAARRLRGEPGYRVCTEADPVTALHHVLVGSQLDEPSPSESLFD